MVNLSGDIDFGDAPTLPCSFTSKEVAGMTHA